MGRAKLKDYFSCAHGDFFCRKYLKKCDRNCTDNGKCSDCRMYYIPLSQHPCSNCRWKGNEENGYTVANNKRRA